MKLIKQIKTSIQKLKKRKDPLHYNKDDYSLLIANLKQKKSISNWSEDKKKILALLEKDELDINDKKIIINKIFGSNHSKEAIRRQIKRLNKEK